MAEEKEEIQEAEKEVKKGGSSFKLVVIVTLIVIVQVAATLGGMYLFKGTKAELTKEELDSDAAAKEEAEAEEVEEEDLKEGEEILGAIYPLEMFIVNLKNDGVIRVEMQLQFTTREVPRRLYSRMPLIRDTVISILSQKAKDDILQNKGREILRADVKKLVNERLMGDLVSAVLFTQYIVQ